MTARRLIIMRHAKAEGHGEKPDFDRELIARGVQDASRVAAQLCAQRLMPDRVLVSTSRRTRDTLCAVLPVLAFDCVIELRDALYEADAPDLRDAVRTAGGHTILLIGHNPSVHQLAVAFAGPEAAAEAGILAGFPTSTAAVFSFGFAIDTIRFQEVLRP